MKRSIHKTAIRLLIETIKIKGYANVADPYSLKAKAEKQGYFLEASRGILTFSKNKKTDIAKGEQLKLF